MKTTPEHDQLLKDIFNGEEDSEFWKSLNQQTSIALRRKRLFRRGKQVLILAVTLLIPASLLFFLNSPSPISSPSVEPEKNSTAQNILRSHPLAKNQVIITKASQVNMIRTQRQDSFLITQAYPVKIIKTDPEANIVKKISDQELLAMFEGHPTALVEADDHTKKLIFLNPEDKALFFGKESGY